MTTIMQRQRSRRKLAALTFLSNISLDGTHRDTRLSLYTYPDAKKNISDSDKENCSVTVSSSNVSVCSPTVTYTNNKQHGKTSVDGSNPPIHHRVSSIKDRSSTTTSIGDIIDRPGPLRKKSNHVSLSEKQSCFSSNESLGNNTNMGSGNTLGIPGCLSESPIPPTKEVRFMKTFTPIHGDERVVLLSKGKMPFHIFSSIPFKKSKLTGTRVDQLKSDGSKRRHISNARPLSTISDSNDHCYIFNPERFDESVEISYCQLLVPSDVSFKRPRRQQSEHSDNPDGNEKPLHPGVARCFSYDPSTHKATAHYLPHNTGEKGSSIYEKDDWRYSASNAVNSQLYVPNVLDDPELRAGKHRKLLRFPSYMTSVIDYTKPSELKKELNDKFREKFPHIQLTLSKLRSLKREMLKISRQECNIDLVTVAQSYVYFERLILKTFVNKPNRKLIAGACLILSAKLNDVKGEMLTNLIEKTESTFRLNRKDLMHWEFAALVALEFSLHLPPWEINAHYQRLLYES